MPRPNQVRFVLDERMSPSNLITSAFAFAFEGMGLLMTRLTDRGWDLPGGHIEAGESPTAALRREVLEESACELKDIRPLGYLHVSVLCEVPPDYPYPYPESYQLIILGHVAQANAFVATEEASERRFFAPHEAEALPWIRANRLL